ncbi:hypothetical protein BD410DRAFT_843175 [Rickenella mellea]|uniref:Uncharacterized protein n=1 Tax=Rickenella mellea TaxID=50990 RepID=A0A4Y7PRM8_9AGAM|nr:hypothetical protein BD410DRAFT_843175 [Rickenella mellea]
MAMHASTSSHHLYPHSHSHHTQHHPDSHSHSHMDADALYYSPSELTFNIAWSPKTEELLRRNLGLSDELELEDGMGIPMMPAYDDDEYEYQADEDEEDDWEEEGKKEGEEGAKARMARRSGSSRYDESFLMALDEQLRAAQDQTRDVDVIADDTSPTLPTSHSLTPPPPTSHFSPPSRTPGSLSRTPLSAPAHLPLPASRTTPTSPSRTPLSASASASRTHLSPSPPTPSASRTPLSASQTSLLLKSSVRSLMQDVGHCNPLSRRCESCCFNASVLDTLDEELRTSPLESFANVCWREAVGEDAAAPGAGASTSKTASPTTRDEGQEKRVYGVYSASAHSFGDIHASSSFIDAVDSGYSDNDDGDASDSASVEKAAHLDADDVEDDPEDFRYPAAPPLSQSEFDPPPIPFPPKDRTPPPQPQRPASPPPKDLFRPVSGADVCPDSPIFFRIPDEFGEFDDFDDSSSTASSYSFTSYSEDPTSTSTTSAREREKKLAIAMDAGTFGKGTYVLSPSSHPHSLQHPRSRSRTRTRTTTTDTSHTTAASDDMGFAGVTTASSSSIPLHVASPGTGHYAHHPNTDYSTGGYYTVAGYTSSAASGNLFGANRAPRSAASATSARSGSESRTNHDRSVNGDSADSQHLAPQTQGLGQQKTYDLPLSFFTIPKAGAGDSIGFFPTAKERERSGKSRKSDKAKPKSGKAKSEAGESVRERTLSSPAGGEKAESRLRKVATSFSRRLKAGA